MLGGLLLGGLIGGLLFGGLGGGFGIGLMDILLLGGLAFLIISFLRRRRAPEPAYSIAGGGSMSAPTQVPAERGGAWSAASAVAEPPASAASTELERGLAHIRSMDARFDPDTLAADARGTFRDVQAAVMARDAAPLRSRLTPEMANVLQNQCDRLRSSRQTNKLERIDVRRAEITEAWQEGGQDFVTVYLAASLLDYTVDDRTGSVLDGSSTVPQEIEEYWTFTRPVGPNPWRLSAIQTG
jgi:predicted lipid-binding transport protein (Tim44 family)